MATQEDIQSHYDVDNNFFAIFLDTKYRAYSCGVWKVAETLEDAQEYKLDRLCRYANVSAGYNVLDVGCGWGGLMNYIVSHYSDSHVHGLTLSTKQFEYIQAASKPNIMVDLCSWQNCPPPERKFDAIISIGAFEHFASVADHSAWIHRDVYKSFFDWCLSVSTTEAQLGLQTIVITRAPTSVSELRDSRYLLQNVFPGSALPSISDIQAAIVDKYEIAALSRIGLDYARTLAEWSARLLQNKDLVVSSYGEETFNHYQTYFDAARRCFESGYVDLLQVSLKRAQQIRVLAK